MVTPNALNIEQPFEFVSAMLQLEPCVFLTRQILEQAVPNTDSSMVDIAWPILFCVSAMYIQSLALFPYASQTAVTVHCSNKQLVLFGSAQQHCHSW